MTLRELPVGRSAVITAVGGSGSLRQHILNMGVIPGTEVTLVQYAPMGDPMELRIHGYELTLRLADAENISVTLLPEGDPTDTEEPWELRDKQPGMHMEHPGLGEGGRYHDRATENPLPEGELLTFALAGNQNSGKTTLFNQLTGAKQHVGNFPGVTVERKDGVIRKHPDTRITDLPGIYSMSPYTGEELVTRQFILDEKPKGIINIVDATNIERNLILTMQLLELEIPMVVALNFMDEVTANGGTIHVNELEAELGVPVIPITASKGEGIRELVDHAIHVARYQEAPLRQDFCSEEDHGGAVHRCLHAIMHLIEDHAKAAGIPVRFAASKLADDDPLVKEALGLDQNEKETIEHILLQMEQERGMDRAAAMADMRFAFVRRVCRQSVVRPRESKEQIRSRKIDRILTGKYTAIPVFIAVMCAVFYLTFNVLGAFLQDLIQKGVDALSALVNAGMTAAEVHPLVRSLVVDGIFGGVGTVLSFLPIIIILFCFLSILEDSGYMARIAFVMDRPLRRIGLSGRSIVPMLMGFGCTVPGVMAARTLPSERDRRTTILMTPFMSCGAKIPVYAFFTAAFFPGHGALVMLALYFLGVLVGIATAGVFRNVIYKGNPVPFVMELPNYRMPGPLNVLRLLWDKTKDFLTRAFTIILLCTIIIWVLQSFDTHFHAAARPQDSLLAVVASFLAPLFKPLGFGDWRFVTALIAGCLAKETIVATISMLFGSMAALPAALSPLGAAAYLVFVLLYVPCAAAMAAIRRELGWKWMLNITALTCILAWLVAGLVSLGGHLLGFA